MKTRTTLAVALVLGTLCAGISSEAWAWGTRSQKTMAAMAMQVIKNEYPTVLRPEGAVGANFELDVLKGARDGHAILEGEVPLITDEAVIQAIATEIQLLRDVRRYGPTSYFAYRMGVLSSLVADTIFPYGFAWDVADKRLQAKVNADIDEHLDSYSFMPSRAGLRYIREVGDYFAKRRSFYGQDKEFIADDYKRGKGYDGFLKEGGPAYFKRSVEAIADVWHTILRFKSDPAMVPASKGALTWYFVLEIEYLLKERKNPHQAESTYSDFEEVNPGLPLSYETIGDLYYDESEVLLKERGVKEWQVAFSLGGPERSRVGRKLSRHYRGVGREFLALAALPGSDDADLPMALRAFQSGLEYEPTSVEVAELIQETNRLMKEREEAKRTVIEIIANAARVQQEAEKAAVIGDYANAIATYRLAVTLLDAVDNRFRDLEKQAKDNKNALERSIDKVINDVIDSASDVIDQGDGLRDQKNWNEAIASFERVPLILDVIPDDEDPTAVSNKQDLLDLASQRIDDTKNAQMRAQAAEAAAREAGGARPAARPAPGGGATTPPFSRTR